LITPAVEVELVGADGGVVPITPRPRLFDWFLVPQGEVTVERRTATSVRLALTSERGIGRQGKHGEELPDVPVGSLPIATFNPNTGALETVSIPLPAPDPATDADIDVMWAAHAALPSATRRWVRRRALWNNVAAETRWSDLELFVPSLPELVGIARHLLTRWPQAEDQEVYWRDVELPGGHEDAVASLRRAGNIGGLRTPKGLIPERSLRRRGSGTPWELAAVAVIAAEVARRLRLEAGPGNSLLLAPLDEVAAVARPRTRRPDPPPSSWPPPLRHFYDTALDVLAASAAAAQGHGTAPLCHLWMLYEGWVASEVLAAVQQSKGRPPDLGPKLHRVHRGGAAWFARWRDADEVVDVWGQLDIGRTPESLCDDTGFTVRSVTSTLIPDSLVAIRRADASRVIAVDAKFRTDRLDPDDAAATGSKYHWGLRPVRNGTPVDLVKVLLVTSGTPIQPYDLAASRIEVHHALPHTKTLDLIPHL